jgi:predicted DNA-binding transcriptional regulator AlpA
LPKNKSISDTSQPRPQPRPRPRREPISPIGAVRLIGKPELLDKIDVSYAFLWKLMQNGEFPRGRAVGDRTMWVESEVDKWIHSRPKRKLRDDVEQ